MFSFKIKVTVTYISWYSDIALYYQSHGMYEHDDQSWTKIDKGQKQSSTLSCDSSYYFCLYFGRQ